jgi:hypothetical protein
MPNHATAMMTPEELDPDALEWDAASAAARH